jgi:hypothetical protein
MPDENKDSGCADGAGSIINDMADCLNAEFGEGSVSCMTLVPLSESGGGPAFVTVNVNLDFKIVVEAIKMFFKKRQVEIDFKDNGREISIKAPFVDHASTMETLNQSRVFIVEVMKGETHELAAMRTIKEKSEQVPEA